MKIGLVQRVRDDAEHLLAHGGAEEEVLALGRDGVDDALHVRPEAHVEHAVGLVEHERVDLVEQDVALAQHVEQAAGRGDEQVDALADLLGLRVVGNAAEHGDDRAAAVGAQRLADLFDLPAELARRGDDEGGRVGRAAVGDGRACHALQDGQDESGRLAGTGLRRAHHVAPGEDARDGLLLDGSRRFVAHGGDAGEQLAAEAECREQRAGRPRAWGRRAARRACAPVALVDAWPRRRGRGAGRGRGRGRGPSGRVPRRRRSAVALVLALARLALRLLACALLGGGLASARGRLGGWSTVAPCAARHSLGAGPAAAAAAAPAALRRTLAPGLIVAFHGGIADWVH